MEWIIEVIKKLKEPEVLVPCLCVAVLAKLLLMKEAQMRDIVNAMIEGNRLMSRMAAILDVLKDRR